MTTEINYRHMEHSTPQKQLVILLKSSFPKIAQISDFRLSFNIFKRLMIVIMQSNLYNWGFQPS